MAVSAEVVICGAGIAGVAAAYHLAVMHGMKDVVLVEQDTPLSLTSDKSTECYRNWWPGPGDAMVALMNRSIDLLEEIARASDNRIQLNRRGYLYATADPSKIALLQHAGEEAARLGAGPLRVHRGLGTGDGGLGTTPLGPPAGGGTEGGVETRRQGDEEPPYGGVARRQGDTPRGQGSGVRGQTLASTQLKTQNHGLSRVEGSKLKTSSPSQPAPCATLVPHPPSPTTQSPIANRQSLDDRSSYIPAPAHGFEGQPDGADLIVDPAVIRVYFPYLTERAVAVLHARRCGWFSAQQLGMYMLEQAREHGVRLVRGQVTGVDMAGGRVRAVQVAQAGATAVIATPHFVAAGGPLLGAVGRLLGVEIPVFSERHIKIAFNDHLGAVPRGAPLLIWADEVALPWSDEERAALAEDEETAWLLGTFPAGVHCRPEGHGASTSLLILWNYHLEPVEPTFPITVEDYYAELALRGMAVMIPGLAQYFDRAPKPYVDGGYYTKTRENRPLIGPLPVAGAYVLGALSGFGLMAAPAAGELLAAHIAGAALPGYAPTFTLARYDDPEYRRLLDNWGDVGQL